MLLRGEQFDRDLDEEMRLHRELREHDRPAPPPGQEPVVQTQVTDTHFFETMRTPLIEGRNFSDADQDGRLRVALINRSMAEKFWPHSDPVGKQLELLDDKKPAIIVGVIKQIEVSDPATPQVYFSYAQSPGIFASLAVRTEGDPMAMANAVRQAVWSVDRDQPMWKVRSLESLMAGSIGDRRYLAFLLSLYAAVALALAAIGIYGVLSYSVSRRIHEIGVRMSLGAQPSHVVRLVIGEGMAKVFVGLVLGLVGSLGLMRLLEGFLYGVTPTDPPKLALASAILAAAGLAACCLPTRAVTVDPMQALRHE